MKKILGLDLGTNSIGWALVKEAENENEKSEINKLGVRVNPLTVDEQQNFEKGKSITTNADRTLKRSMRRNLQRYKLRRENLIEILKENGFISDETILSENGNFTTFETYRLRAKAATEEITLEQFARVLLMINKKRGYKSSRKAKGTEDGTLIDGMEVAKRLYDENLTPGQLSLQLINEGKKYLPEFYRSDLQIEFDRIWTKQQEFYPEILTEELQEEIRGKKREAVYAICVKQFVWKETHTVWNNDEGRNEEVEKEHTIVGYKRNGNTQEQKFENLVWRTKGLTDRLLLEELVVVLQEINAKINSSSGYLGAISDRSKELYFNKQTVGQYQMAVLANDPNASLRNMVFYRQDYLDEFNTIWEKQAEFHQELTPELKQEIRDVVIFYQRRLKSQKGLISFCEFESRQIEVEIDGNKKIKIVGSRVIPRSSPLFQEFKIWQRLNDIEVYPTNEKNKKRKLNARRLTQDEKESLFLGLSFRDKLTKNQALILLDLQEFDIKFENIDGNKTQYELFKAYKKIIELSGCEINDDYSIETIEKIFNDMSINTDILYFDSQKPLDEQPMYKLYHLLYSFEGDKSNSGIENLLNKLKELYGFEKEYAKILAGVEFQKDYGSLSAKAITKILPLMKLGQDYTTACANIYERHSKSSLTTEELEKKVYKDRLEILKKNSLRNPVVEKILNQMINTVNSIIETYGKPDEIRIELARELKKNADERFMLTNKVKENTEEIEKIHVVLKKDFGISNPSRNDIIRYKLWEELTPNAHKPLYGSKENLQKEISPAILFTKEIEIEHILPKARLFDDSFSNKTLVFSSDNKNKGEKTALDYAMQEESGLDNYINRVISVYGTKTTKKVVKNPKTKEKKVVTETTTFDKLFKKHDDSFKTSKKHKASIEKWNKLTETERRKLVKPWGLMNDVEKKIEVINKYYSNKLKKLIITASELPEGFINRDLANTHYITKKAKEMLGDLVKFVVSTTGSITDRLREDWQLVDVMKEINMPKYEKIGLVENQERINYETDEVRYVKKITDWTKRNDHRHHAMDALTVAFTKRQFIQYLNNLNARRTDENTTISNTEKEEQDNFAITSEDIVMSTRDVLGIEKNYLERDKRNKLRFIPPMPLNEFRAEAKKHLENTLISIKAKNKVVTSNINISKKHGNTNKKVQSTPRGQLHLETVYGSQRQYAVKEEAVNAKFDTDKIASVTKPTYRKALLERLNQFDNDAKKAFTGKNSLSKNPIWLDADKTISVPEKVKTVSFETIYTIRKPISPDLKLDKVIDNKIRQILQKRLDQYGGNAKNAFSNLEENPIWLNEEKGIAIKRVTISGISNAVALHTKKDKEGLPVLNKDGKEQATDFVNTGNNHHVAVYRKPVLDKMGQIEVDENGEIKYELEEKVVSFYEAVARANARLPIVDKEYKQVEGYEFLFTMKQNEYFVFPKKEMRETVNEETGELTEEEVITFNPIDYSEDWFKNPENYATISPNLFRVQKFSFKNYVFRHHLETSIKDTSSILRGITWTDFRSSKGLDQIVKVRINHIGEIVSIGEY